MRPRRALTGGLLATIALLAVNPPRFAALISETGALRRTLEQRRDPLPELTDFLDDVRRSTERGDAILIVLPAPAWEAYQYGYYRASYLLAGRVVLPMMDEEGRPPDRLGHADYVAVFGAPYEGEGVVWQRGAGTLVKRE